MQLVGPLLIERVENEAKHAKNACSLPKAGLAASGQFHILFCNLRPTFEKLFRGVNRALRHAPNFNRAISLICAVRPTFMKSTPYHNEIWLAWPINKCFACKSGDPLPRISYLGQ